MCSQHPRSCPPIASGRYVWRTDGIGDCVRDARLPFSGHLKKGKFTYAKDSRLADCVNGPAGMVASQVFTFRNHVFRPEHRYRGEESTK